LNAVKLPLLGLHILDASLGVVAQGAYIADPVEPGKGSSVASRCALVRERRNEVAAVVLGPGAGQVDSLRSVALSDYGAVAVAAQGELVLPPGDSVAVVLDRPVRRCFSRCCHHMLFLPNVNAARSRARALGPTRAAQTDSVPTDSLQLTCCRSPWR